MKNIRTARPVILLAAVCAALALAGSVQASISVRDPSDFVQQSDARQFPHHDKKLAPTLEEVLEPFNFQGQDYATYFVSQNAMNEQLAGRGLSRTVSSFVNGQQINTWYSAAEDRSVVCVSEIGGGQYTQAVYVMPGRIKRADLMPLF